MTIKHKQKKKKKFRTKMVTKLTIKVQCLSTSVYALFVKKVAFTEK